MGQLFCKAASTAATTAAPTAVFFSELEDPCQSSGEEDSIGVLLGITERLLPVDAESSLWLDCSWGGLAKLGGDFQHFRRLQSVRAADFVPRID